VLNPKGLRAKIADLLILKGLKSFVFNSIRNCSQVLNLKDLKSFRVYEFWEVLGFSEARGRMAQNGNEGLGRIE
jgi:hypothetical protein